MRRALQLGRRGLGRTSPNPPVGALIVKDRAVVGTGWHEHAGGAHAEVLALEQAGRAARGATLYLTLEPCTHVGRTPPCAPHVVAAGIRRVVIGALDPNPIVHRRGVAALRRAGIETTVGVEQSSADHLIRFFKRHVESKLPFVRLKLAASADGRIATRTGASRWITGPEARAMVHRWRDELDAVMVGVDTVLADDPALTCRRRGGRDPLRIVVDSRLRLPLDAKLFSAGRSPVWIVTSRHHDRRRAERLTAHGATVLPVPTRDGKIDLRALFRLLGRRDIVSVLVEGGSRLAAALVRSRLVDELCWFSAPLLIGGDGVPMVGALGVTTPARAVRLEQLHMSQVGADVLHVARLAGRR